MFRTKNKMAFKMWFTHQFRGHHPLSKRRKWYIKLSIKGRIKVIKLRNHRHWRQNKRKSFTDGNF